MPLSFMFAYNLVILSRVASVIGKGRQRWVDRFCLECLLVAMA